jgi:transposase-like protein
MEKKTQNYTPEQTQQIVQFYQDGQSVEMIAEAVGKSVRSVVAKLSREGVYKAKSYVSKTGEKPVKKDVVADEIAAILLLTEAETESLTKANKTALAKILAAVR